MEFPLTLLPPENHYYFRKAFPARYESGTAFALCVIFSGVFNVSLRLPGGGEPVHMPLASTQGALVLLPPGASIASKCREAQVEAAIICFQNEDLSFDPVTRTSVLELPPARQRIETMKKLTAREIVEIRPIIEETHSYNSQSLTYGARFIAAADTLYILTRLFRSKDRLLIAGKTQSPARELQTYLNANPENARLDDIARKMRLSTRKLRYQFKRDMGITPKKHQLRELVHIARDYIVSTRLPFAQIAETLGFASPSYFAYFIKRHTGKTPTQLRTNSRKATS